ncbi:hypothetical protein FQR65_LT11472 [Abscondita terminalis]|nr:hypothetical protein FQR65_LT11472 [Abscondita terminalis]
MFLTIFTITSSVAISTWILFCCAFYLWHYIIEVVLDLPIVGQSPCSAHAGIKLLIQKIIQEAIGLPHMKKISDQSSSPSEISNRTYEDLLSTAIINKIVQTYQDAPSSSTNSVSSQHSTASLHNNTEFYLGEETLESKWKKPNSISGDHDTASVSSVEEWVRSDSSTGSTKYVDRRSLTIKQKVGDVSSSDEDEVAQTKHKKSNWKENWTLQKRHFAGTASPIPVPMLVPNPTTEAKVLIGDREAEDTSDLSDIGSDYGETEKAPRIESLLIDSKTIIGGKNIIEMQNEIQSDGSIDDSEIAQEKGRILDQILPTPEVTHCLNVKESVELSSFDSHIEQDSEYTEKYATLPKTIVKESSNLPNSTEESSQLTNGHNDDTKVEHEKEEEIKPFEGSYSMREKQKWENAVEMKNNPYTAESINKRLVKSSFTDVSSLFGRDYYIKEASRATGARKLKTSEDGDEMLTPTMQQPQSEVNGFLYQAVPAIVDPEESQSDSPILTSPIPPNLLEISSDSDLSIERVYNLNSGKVYETVGGVHKEIVKRSASPEGIKFQPTSEFDKTFTVTDENHNSTTVQKKHSFLKSLTETVSDKDVFQDADTTFSEINNTSYESISSEDNNVPLHVTTEERVTSNSFITENTNGRYSIQEFSLEFSTDGENRTSADSSLNVNSDAEIIDLKDKHLVKERLGIFSKPHQNLGSSISKKNIKKEKPFSSEESIQQSHEEVDTSVNDLKKKFDHVEGRDVGKKQIHSLTARSISQTIRKELREVQENSVNDSNKFMCVK